MPRTVPGVPLVAILCALFMFVVVSVLFYAVKSSLAARAANRTTTVERLFEPVIAGAGAGA